MPYINNPVIIAQQPDFRSAVRSLLSNYCTEQVLQQPLWTTGSGSILPYTRRLAFAKDWISGSLPQTVPVRQAAQMLAEVDSTLLEQLQNNLFRGLFSDNPTGRNLLEARTGIAAGMQHVGFQSGVSIFDALCGISQQDML